LQTINIPERYAGGFAKIKSLLTPEVERVALALDQASIGTRKELARLIAPVLPKSAPEDVKAIVETLQSLYSVRTSMDLSVDQFVESLGSAIKQSEDADIKLSDASEISRVKHTLRTLLSVRSLTLKSKAQDLLREHANTFCDARIVTDLRPVFDFDIAAGPAGVVVTHTLKVEYHDRGDHTDIRIAIDKDDIETLISVLLRAQEKAEALTAFSARTNLGVLAE
jgi:hypothetical protein